MLAGSPTRRRRTRDGLPDERGPFILTLPLPLPFPLASGSAPGSTLPPSTSAWPTSWAVTRTGLPPAGDGELTNSKIRCYAPASPPVLLGVRNIEASSGKQGIGTCGLKAQSS